VTAALEAFSAEAASVVGKAADSRPVDPAAARGGGGPSRT
jgi:hypothetical protein